MVKVLRLSHDLGSIFRRPARRPQRCLKLAAEGRTHHSFSVTTRCLAPGEWSERARIAFSSDCFSTFDAHFGGGQRSSVPGSECRRQQTAGAAAGTDYWPL